MKLQEFIDRLETIKKMRKDAEDYRVVVVCDNGGMGGRYRVNVEHVNSGFDWEKGDIVITTDETLIAKKK